MRAIEVEVLAGVEHVEAADPRADRQRRAATAPSRRAPPTASHPPTGATAIASPRNSCV